MLHVQVNLPDHVSQGMVLLVDGKDGSVGNLGVLLSRDLLLPVKQQKRLEGWGSVHFSVSKRPRMNLTDDFHHKLVTNNICRVRALIIH